jgi:hypothetical protein
MMQVNMLFCVFSSTYPRFRESFCMAKGSEKIILVFEDVFKQIKNQFPNSEKKRLILKYV